MATNLCMTEIHRKAIRRLSRQLEKSISLTGLISELHAEEIISDMDRKHIEAERIKDNGVKELLKIISQKPDTAFDGFCAALVKEEQKHLATLLREKVKELLEIEEAENHASGKRKLEDSATSSNTPSPGGTKKKARPAEVPESQAASSSSEPDYHMYHLSKTGDQAGEYYDIEDQVKKYIIPGHNWIPEVTSIAKVVNAKLQANWERAKSDMNNPERSALKFHGTDSTALANILNNGFILSDKRGMFGKGIYFATDSSKAAQEKYTKGSNMLLVCDVLLGKSLTVDSHQKDMTQDNLKAMGYDSLYAKRDSRNTGGVYNDEYVVYRPEQALPKYVVHFKTKVNN